jgi:hypothetical protein
LRCGARSFLPVAQTKNEEAIAERIRNEGELIVSNLFRLANGEGTAAVQACSLLMDRGYGRQANDINVKKSIDLSQIHLDALRALSAHQTDQQRAKMIEVHATKEAAVDAVVDENVADAGTVADAAESAAAESEIDMGKFDDQSESEDIDPFSGSRDMCRLNVPQATVQRSL